MNATVAPALVVRAHDRRPVVSQPPTLHVSSHPAILHKLAVLRDVATEPKKFREVVRELSWLLGYEALADVKVRPLTIQTPIEEMEASQLADRIGLVPILRAGLGMVEGVARLVPSARVGHIGLQRDELTAVASQYYSKLPARLDQSYVLMIDPMLATGGSAVAALDVLQHAGATVIRMICIVAAPEGVELVQRHHPGVRIYTPAIDRHLNDQKYIVPGLGDFGDRLYGTL
jgi:uracil phosphoribosyltransferase